MESMKGHRVKDCPLHLDTCYPSCFYWSNKCDYDARTLKQLDDIRAQREVRIWPR